jgi:acyl-coenzyme A synthetase/AMP-(fatty) acid ligase
VRAPGATGAQAIAPPHDHAYFAAGSHKAKPRGRMMRTSTFDYEAAHRGFRWSVPETFNFGVDVVDRWAGERPGHLALIWRNEAGDERRFTFTEIARLTDRLAGALRQRGIGKGDRVLVMLPRVPEWQLAMVALAKLGAVPVPSVTMLTPKDIAYRMENGGIVGAVTMRDEIAKFAALPALRCVLAVGGAANGWEDFDAAMQGAPEDFEPAIVAAEDTAVLYYTSGSTGLPKGVMQSARALYAWRVSAQYWLTLTPDDVMFCTADTGWSKAGTSILYGPWSQGSTVLFYDGRFDPDMRFDLLERYGVTVFCAAATEFRRLITTDIKLRDLSALRLTVSAGESVNPEIVGRWEEMTGQRIFEAYGQTEILMLICNYPGTPIRLGSTGRPLPGTDAIVIDESRRPLPPGEVGQLAIRLPNPQLMLGYWGDPEKTAATQTLVDGVPYYLTGDNVWRDQDGYIFYAGRGDDVIKASGYRIGPQEVENALMEHPAVQEAAAVGSPDADRGEVVKAFIVLHEGYVGDAALVEDIQQHVKRVTAPYKYPRRIEFVVDLPKSVVGKIDRRALRQREKDRAAEGKSRT